MLSGLSINTITTANNLGNPKLGATFLASPNELKPNTGASPEAQANTEATSEAQTTTETKPESQPAEAPQASFKEIVKKTMNESNETAVQVKATLRVDVDSEDTTDLEEMSEAISALMATITAALSTNTQDIELNLDLVDISITELEAYASAVELVDTEVQKLMNDAIEAISDIEMTELADLTQQAEQLDDLQSLHEELMELADEIEYLQDTQPESTNIVPKHDTRMLELPQGMAVETMPTTKPLEFEIQDTIQPKPVLEQIPETAKVEQAPELVQQAAAMEILVKPKLEIEQSIQETEAHIDIQRPLLETKETTKPKDFLDQVKFISFTEKSPTIKEETSSKINLDSSTKQILIQVAEELKTAIAARVQTRTETSTEPEIELDLHSELVDVSESQSSDIFTKVIADANKPIVTGEASRVETQVFSPKQVLHILPEKILETPVDTQQTLSFKLNPRNLGNITITINRTTEGVTVQMLADNDAAVSSLKNDMSNLHGSLREKGLELKDLDISKASSEAAYNQQQERGDFNEAREEQKKRMAETRPHWLQDAPEANFEKQLKGMLNKWNLRK